MNPCGLGSAFILISSWRGSREEWRGPYVQDGWVVCPRAHDDILLLCGTCAGAQRRFPGQQVDPGPGLRGSDPRQGCDHPLQPLRHALLGLVSKLGPPLQRAICSAWGKWGEEEGRTHLAE